MSTIVKVIEVIGQSNKSLEDAVQNVLTETSKTVSDIREIWVSGTKAIVENGKIVEWRVTTKVSFQVKGHS